MPDRDQNIETFANRIFRRADGLDDIVPHTHQPDWKDRPSLSRLYPDLPRMPLPSPAHLFRNYSSQAACRATGERVHPGVPSLSILLYLVAGLLRRKLDMNWNTDPSAVKFLNQEYGRGSASGGGLYPVQIYVVAAKQQDLKAGVYHYSSAQHALVPVRHGDWTQELSIATKMPDAAPEQYPYFLIFSVDFWTNCFKYHNFGYHVCSEDVGVMLATAELVADALGIAYGSMLTFDDVAANKVIGVDGRSESVFAVVGIGEARPSQQTAQTLRSNTGIPDVKKYWQRTSRVHIPEELTSVHESTLLKQAVPGPPRKAMGSEQNDSIDSLEQTIRSYLPSIFIARRSAWSSMRGNRSVACEKLHELLQFVSRRVEESATREGLPENSLTLSVQANDIQGYARGAYIWKRGTASLQPRPAASLNVWQSTYSMNNYNIDETGCILFVVGNLRSVLDHYGARGYRVLNAYVGMLAQLTYVAAAALDLDCGVVLGVRAQHVKQTLMLESGQNVFLAIYLSEAQQRSELFRFQLLPDAPIWNPVN